MRAGDAKRARIVLLASEGIANSRIADLTDATVVTVLKWRARYEELGIAGLGDADRSGRPRHLDHADIVAATLIPPPKKYGVTHWSSRLLASHLKIGNATVARAWREYGVRPMRIGDAEKRTHVYKRHGTTTLFAALEIATGHVTGAVKPKHRRQEFLAFLRQLDRAYPDVELHLVMDNYATHKTPEVKAWLEQRPRFNVHFPPTSGSWLNLVEVWFGIIDKQAIRRGIFTSVQDLNAKIRQFITGWNDRKHPFIWTKTPEQILAKANRQPTSETRHERWEPGPIACLAQSSQTRARSGLRESP